MRHPFDAVVFHHHRAQNALRAETGGDAFEDECQTLARLLRLQQQGGRGLFERMDFVCGESEVAHRGEQLRLGKMLGQQPGQVLDVARGRSGANRELPPFARSLRPHGVMAPGQGERRDPAVPGRQPTRHLQQQSTCAEQEGGRELDAKRQFELAVERVGQLHPGMRLHPQTVGVVQARQELGVKPATESAARQGADIAQRPTPEPGERCLVRGHRRQHAQRQGVQQCFQRLREPVGHAGASERDRRQTGRCPRQLLDPQGVALVTHALHELALAPEQPNAGLEFHDDARRH